MPDRIFLTAAELAERWGMSEKTLESWRSAGKGPEFVKIVGAVRYRLTDVEKYETEHTVSGGDR